MVYFVGCQIRQPQPVGDVDGIDRLHQLAELGDDFLHLLDLLHLPQRHGHGGQLVGGVGWFRLARHQPADRAGKGGEQRVLLVDFFKPFPAANQGGFDGLLQLLAMYWQSYRGNVFSGYLLLVSAFIWYLTAQAFWGAFPPAHTGMVIPPILSFLCLLAGNNSLKFLFSSKKLKESQEVE